MKFEYLGDAMDLWKARMLELLRRSSAPPRRLRLLPMFSDHDWGPAQVEAYARLLGGGASDVLASHRYTWAGRAAYFTVALGDQEDVFIDPDTGILRKRGTQKHCHPQDLERLLRADNVVCCYQHRIRVAKPWLMPLIEGLWPSAPCDGLVYEGGQVGMLWLSRASGRLDALESTIRAALGPSAVASRVWRRAAHPPRR